MTCIHCFSVTGDRFTALTSPVFWWFIPSSPFTLKIREFYGLHSLPLENVTLNNLVWKVGLNLKSICIIMKWIYQWKNWKYEVLSQFLNDGENDLNCFMTMSEQSLLLMGVHEKFEEILCLNQYVFPIHAEPHVKKVTFIETSLYFSWKKSEKVSFWSFIQILYLHLP